MKQLMDSRLFSLLSKKDRNNNLFKELKEAYEEFSVKLLEKLQTESNITKLYYHLGFVRLELVGIRDGLSDKEEKKCLKIYNQGNLSH